MKKIVYWSPIVSKIATYNAVINSAKSLKKYSNNYDVSIINTIGEYDELINNNDNINLINFHKVKKKYYGSGFWKTRFSYLKIFLNNFYKLKSFLDREKPDVLIIHLVTSLPLVLLILFNFKTKFILRISGLPKMNFFRSLLWKLSLKKIYHVISPTENTKKFLLKLNLIDKNRISTVYDPIIQVNKQKKLIKENIEYKNYFISIGRLTKQKNFIFLIKAFNSFYKENLINEKLLILGEGEQKNEMKKLINLYKLNDKIILLGYKKNVHKYLNNSKAFILSSLWEDPGFVLIEAAFCRASIISSDCESGPLEFLKNKNNGFLFESNSQESLKKTLLNLKNLDKEKINIKKKNALIETRNFTLIKHFKDLNFILSI